MGVVVYSRPFSYDLLSGLDLAYQKNIAMEKKLDKELYDE